MNMSKSNGKNRPFLRTLSNNVGADCNKFHHKDETGLGLTKYHEALPITEQKRKLSIISEQRRRFGANPGGNSELVIVAENARKYSANMRVDSCAHTTLLVDSGCDNTDNGINGLEHFEVVTVDEKSDSCVAKAWTMYKLVFVSLSIIIAVFDLVADWLAVRDFHRFGGGDMAIALNVFIGLSTVLFLMELINGVASVRVYGLGQGDRDAVEVWREALSYGLLLLEDLPVTVIMFLTFRGAKCELFSRIFNDSKVARLALLAAFVSSLWKGLISFKYLVQCLCGEKFVKQKKKKPRRPTALQRQNTMSWEDRVFCWGCVRCRPMRIVINIVVSVFAGYVFTQLWASGPFELRPECRPPTMDEHSSNLFISNVTTTGGMN